MKKQTKKSNETPKVSFRLSQKEIDGLNKLAAKHGHTFSSYVRHQLRRHVAEALAT
jgi:predicted DNA-binding protein